MERFRYKGERVHCNGVTEGGKQMGVSLKWNFPRKSGCKQNGRQKEIILVLSKKKRGVRVQQKKRTQIPFGQNKSESAAINKN